MKPTLDQPNEFIGGDARVESPHCVYQGRLDAIQRSNGELCLTFRHLAHMAHVKSNTGDTWWLPVYLGEHATYEMRFTLKREVNPKQPYTLMFETDTGERIVLMTHQHPGLLNYTWLSLAT